ncbi:MAG: hypothetical protein IPN77_22425 [Sandaracinaceae bacterium]|nr:hypothetical protein [Sandaracinaceae bacterium]
MATLHDEWDCELTDARLFEWQRLVVEGQRGARVAAGRYREDGCARRAIVTTWIGAS